ncbi:MAG: hypothetical protein PHO01_00210 [Desulfotomaculaceae bacterium]|nr:hypothetical protein [Desulfotomaculaceae bacterium]
MAVNILLCLAPRKVGLTVDNNQSRLNKATDGVALTAADDPLSTSKSDLDNRIIELCIMLRYQFSCGFDGRKSIYWYYAPIKGILNSFPVSLLNTIIDW